MDLMTDGTEPVPLEIKDSYCHMPMGAKKIPHFGKKNKLLGRQMLYMISSGSKEPRIYLVHPWASQWLLFPV